jgi:type II secretory pathway pseudopilin PulG
MRPASRTTGFTLSELLLVVALLLILVILAAPRYMALRDRIAVDGAASGIVRALVDTRAAAVRLGTRAAVAIDTQTAALAVHVQADTLARIPLHGLFGVTLASSRDSMAYSATGLGYGASNASIIVRRGAAAETVSISRTGRVRR